MKSNVIMKSESDRNLFGMTIRQETKTGFLNLSDLQACFEKIRIEKKWTNKHVPELISRDENVERIFYILEKQNLITVDLSTFIESVKNKGIATVLKTLNAYKTTGARHTKTTFVNPYIWALIALELSPEFYANAIMWLTDKLILNRIEAGNFYVKLTDNIKKWNLDGYQYASLAKALNFIVYNRHEPGIRDKSGQKQLKELYELESKMAFAIEMGYITSFDMLLSELRKIYLGITCTNFITSQAAIKRTNKS